MRTLYLEPIEIKIVQIALKRMKSDFELEQLLGLAGKDTKMQKDMIVFSDRLIAEIGNQVNGKSSRSKKQKEKRDE